jgi:hypothetical protein
MNKILLYLTLFSSLLENLAFLLRASELSAMKLDPKANIQYPKTVHGVPHSHSGLVSQLIISRLQFTSFPINNSLSTLPFGSIQSELLAVSLSSHK